MKRNTYRHVRSRRGKHGEIRQTVCVVDPRPRDYEQWRSTAESCGLQLIFVASAEEALRVAPVNSIALWVVNTDLPGLSGLDLCAMLRSRSARAPVFVIAEEYSIALELAAWGANASMFGCKPEHAHWLDAWLRAGCAGVPRRLSFFPRETCTGRQASTLQTCC